MKCKKVYTEKSSTNFFFNIFYAWKARFPQQLQLKIDFIARELNKRTLYTLWSRIRTNTHFIHNTTQSIHVLTNTHKYSNRYTYA